MRLFTIIQVKIKFIVVIAMVVVLSCTYPVYSQVELVVDAGH